MQKISPGGRAVVPMGSANPLPARAFDPKTLRVPTPVDGIQANSCRNVCCPNFGVLPRIEAGSGHKRGQDEADGYVLISHGKREGQKKLRCKHCGEILSLTSNLGIKEDARSNLGRLAPKRISSLRENWLRERCQIGCNSRGLLLGNGRTPSGAPRYRCKACRKTATESSGRRAQRKLHENKSVFQMLINKSPIRAIARVTDLSPKRRSARG